MNQKNKKQFNNIEAKLLADFNGQNLNLIRFSKIAKEKDISFEVKSLATNLIKEQKIIFSEINKITKQKLIIIPNTNFEANYIDQLKIKDEEFQKKYLEVATVILKNQIDDLRKLSNETQDTDFKILALQTIVKLSFSLEVAENQLEDNI